jgi:hypothetical protein
MKVENYTWRDGKHVLVTHELGQREIRFVLGPLPLGWLIACRKAGPDCHLVAAGILSSTGSQIETKIQKWVAVTELFGQALGLSRFRRYRAINGLEAVGLAEVKRKPNHAPRVRLVPWKKINA